MNESMKALIDRTNYGLGKGTELTGIVESAFLLAQRIGKGEEFIGCLNFLPDEKCLNIPVHGLNELRDKIIGSYVNMQGQKVR